MKYLHIHLAFWAAFIIYEMSILVFSAAHLSNFYDYAFHYAVNILLFYFNAWGFIYIFDSKLNRFFGISLLIIIEIAAYLFIQYLLLLLYQFVKVPVRWNIFTSSTQIVLHIYRAVYFIGLSIAYWFALSVNKQKKMIFDLESQKLQEDKQKIDLENKLVQAKNAYLQSQLSPHLLFNTLNFIYNSVRKVSDQAASAILLLSDMMRYALADAAIDGKVYLKDEIAHIKNMVKLNQLRFNDNLNLELNLKGTFNNEKIIPLLLISFVENIYKHGDLTDSKFPAEINIALYGGILKMDCTNKKPRSKRDNGWGIGTENAKARLAGNYPDNYTLNIIDNSYRYDVSLVLHL